MSAAIKRFICPDCYARHDDEYEARECCRIGVVWECSTCGAEYDDEARADECCAVDSDGEPLPYRPTAAELEAAGQMRLLL
ncbi:MAG: hypothetical protein H3C26_20240 [Rhodocyclaceae bacterium]|nr:hypothetical protein [Rhodocyclaceae bacterium]